MSVRKCMDCGVSIEHRTHRARRCEACAAKKAKWDKKHPVYADMVFLASEYPGDLKLCRKCRFWSSYGSYCNYAGMVGRSRLTLNGGDLDKLYPCKEFEPKEGSKCGMDKRIGASRSAW